MTQNDDWRPGASLGRLRLRAALLSAVRAFFAGRSVMEIETPALSPAAITSPALASFEVYESGGAFAGYLHTSPEFHMKRLLAAGCCDIYQICRVFRCGELGTRHNPEFTLLEWYRQGLDHHGLIEEVAELVCTLLPPGLLRGPHEVLTYREVFLKHLGVDPLLATAAELAKIAKSKAIRVTENFGDERDAWLDLLLSHLIEPKLGRCGMTFVEGFPASQAALARLDSDDPRVASRFELYLEGLELANGFYELTDAAAQRARFEVELAERKATGLARVPMDRRFLDALEYGNLPDCSGVALGFDRLVMIAARAGRLDDIVAFSSLRA